MKKLSLLVLLPLFALPLPVKASDIVQVSGVWARATAPGQKVAGVFLEITASADARLVGARTPAASVAELHFMSMEGGVMRMREVEQIDLPQGATISLKPGGYHVMLFDLKRPLRPGESIPLTLTVLDRDNRATAVETAVSVRNLDGSEPR
jgi:periplasmic copper chaperone A